MIPRFRKAALALALAVSPALLSARPAEVFVLWLGAGAWDCTTTIRGGHFDRIEPYLFLDRTDRIVLSEPQRVVCTTTLRGSAAGLHVFADAGDNAALQFSSRRATQEVKLSELPARGEKIIPFGNDFLIFGRGDPGFGPQDDERKALPPVFEPPKPENAVALPAAGWPAGTPVQITFSAGSKEALAVRRVGNNDGVLYLELFDPEQPLRGKADVALGGQAVGSVALAQALWLALTPRLGTITLAIACPDGTRTMTAPTTLVEARKNRLFVDGEPFLIKGTLPGSSLPDEDAQFIKGMGMNTLRLFQNGGIQKYAERDGFMAIASIQGRHLRKLSDYTGEGGAEKLAKDLQEFYPTERENGAIAAASPNTLVIQLDNERTTLGANPLDTPSGTAGADPWSEFLRGEQGEFRRLDRILAEDWNLVKPLAPMLPLGYANESQGYIAPYFLDVAMHNSYLAKDRYAVPLARFVRWEGGERRPFINTEYGANRYTPEAYHRANNSPVLEKLQAWGYRQAWKAFLEAGTSGGTCYKLYDSAPGSGLDQGTSNFGIMTYDHQPKLACWDLWHLWRDFEIAPAPGGEQALQVTYKRDYWARDCKLVIRPEGGKEMTLALADVPPNSQRVVKMPFATGAFRWQLDFTTHGGLKMSATGAYPEAVEEADFLERMKPRPTFAFLQHLLRAKVETVQGRPAPPTVIEMKRSDGVVPVAFLCPNGVIYLTAFARLRPGDSFHGKADLATSFTGTVEAVDEWTGKPLGTPVRTETNTSGLTIKDVAIPLIPGPIGQRSNEPFALPVFRISPKPLGRISE